MARKRTKEFYSEIDQIGVDPTVVSPAATWGLHKNTLMPQKVLLEPLFD